MLKFLIDNIFVLGVFFNRQSAQTVIFFSSLVPLLVGGIQEKRKAASPYKKSDKQLARFFIFAFRFTNDVISLNNFKFCNFIDLIYHIEACSKGYHSYT